MFSFKAFPKQSSLLLFQPDYSFCWPTAPAFVSDLFGVVLRFRKGKVQVAHEVAGLAPAMGLQLASVTEGEALAAGRDAA